MSDEEVSAGTPAPALPTIIRAASIVLLIFGFGTVLFSLPAVFNPAAGRCHLARSWLDTANTDKKEWNNVDTGGRKAKDLPCAEAIRLADQIPLKEKGTKTASVPSESALRIQNAVAVVMGAGQAAAGFLVLRRQNRQGRTLAIGFSAVGIILQVFGVLSLGVFAFVVYAFTFSPASRELWPKQPR